MTFAKNLERFHKDPLFLGIRQGQLGPELERPGFAREPNVELNWYTNVLGVARAFVATKGPSAAEKVFWRNSLRPYRWVGRDASQPRA